MDSLSFPISFFERPCDRAFLLMLGWEWSGSGAELRIMLFLTWKHFSLGSAPTIKVEEFTEELLESFVGWPEDRRGKFMAAALKSGFMVRSSSGDGEYLSLADFENVNRSKISNAQKGGMARWLGTYHKKSQAAAEEMLKLWTSRGDDLVEGASEEDVKRALLIANNFCQCAKLNLPAEGELRRIYLKECLEISAAFTDPDLKKLYLYVLQHREDSSIIPRDLRLLVKVDLLKGFHQSMSRPE